MAGIFGRAFGMAMIGLALWAAPLAAQGTPPAAADARVPTVQQALDIATLANPVISPDGRRIVYEQTRTNWTSNSFEIDLWIADANGQNRHRLTTAANSNVAAAWSPDGRSIAFLSDRPAALPKSPANRRQLWVMQADGGEAQQVTRFENGVNSFAWAPDSKRLGVISNRETPDDLKNRKESYGDYQIVRGDYAAAQLWLVEIAVPDAAGRTPTAPAPRALTNGRDFNVDNFDWSPDGTRIAFASTRDPDIISGVTGKIQTVDLASGKITLLVDDKGPHDNPHWSPDGKMIAFETSNGSPDYYYANGRIAVVPASGGTPRIVSESFDEDAHLIEWNSRGIWFQALARMESGLFRIDPATSAVTRVALAGTPIARGFTFARTGPEIAYIGADANRFPEVYAATLGKGSPVQITRGGEQFAGFELARRSVVSWKSSDGTTIEGVLYTPANLDPKKRYPLLVVIHGGPTGIDVPVIGPDRYYPVERFVAKGAVVLKPNYRGSAGYGAAFRALNVRNLGVGDYQDVISGVDALVAKGLVDPARVGAMGWSQGGYISAFIATASDRFRAVSVGAGISDWLTYYANTDITPFTPQYLKATPWDDPEIYRKTSPISYLKTARTPTLIQHGSEDHRVPIANAYELRQALEDKGVPVKMVVYQGFGHPINKPKQQRAVIEENENWFGHYIFGAPLAPDLKPDAAKTDKDSAGK